MKFLIFIGLYFFSPTYSQNLSIHFDFGSSRIPDQEKKRLDSLLRSMDPEARYKIKLIGHTDSVGTQGNNLELSEKRARALKAFFSKSSIEMYFETLGQSFKKPLQKNDSEEGMAQNRRCDIYVELIPNGLPEWETAVTVYPIDAHKKSLLYTQNGCQVLVAPGSFAIEGTDTVEIHITEYKDPVDFLVGGLPMSYEQNNKTYLYESEQMLKIEAFVNDRPVKLRKLLGLKCPNVDTSRGVKLYEFKGKVPKAALQRLVRGFGRVEYMPIEQSLQENQQKPGEEPLAPDKPLTSIYQRNDTKTVSTDARQTSKRRQKNSKNRPISKMIQILNSEKASSQSKSNNHTAVKLEPDTGKGFILEPDTGRVFTFYSSYRRSMSKNKTIGKDNSGNDGVSPCYTCQEHLCDSTTFFKLLHTSLKRAESDTGFNLPAHIDFRHYYDRYKNLSYDGLCLKSKKDPAHSFSVKANFKKRFLSKALLLNITSAEGNPEYAPLNTTKWILYYGRRKHKLAILKALKISDLRILQSKHKSDFLIELKADTMFYAFQAVTKKPKTTLLQYKSYLKLYEKRVRKFDDSVRRYFDVHHENIDSLYCLFRFTEKLSSPSWKWRPCHDTPSPSPPCHPFKFFANHYTYKNVNTYRGCKGIVDLLQRHRQNNTVPKYQEICDFDCLGDWVSYYRDHQDEFRSQLLKIKEDHISAWTCACDMSSNLPSNRKSPCPDSVWRPNAIGDEVIYIGLGVYNFDREILTENTQSIPYPTYLNHNGDTILRCNHVEALYGSEALLCRHQTYTILAGFNGLLEQVYNEKLTLVLGKINILFFVDPRLTKYYKLRLDLRQQKEPVRQTAFKLEDITQHASSVESLKKELLKE